jgi:tetratricopeptide (TPR) repeat protein
MNTFEQILHRLLSQSKGRQIVFFVGAGISLDSPSNLPSTGTFIDAILRQAFEDESDREEIRQFINPASPKRLVDGHYLRFETFIEAVTSIGNDSSLDLLRCFSVCEEPNRNHSMLAALIGLGHYVVTTNFDCLIEIACGRLGIDCCQVIYESDFGRYLEAPELHRNTLFKIHGSFTKNGHHSTDSMNATLSSLAALGDQMSRAPNKKKVLKELIGTHPVIVLGYSGSDTFDIVPIFTSTPSNEPLIWVNHSQEPTYFDSKSIPNLSRDPVGRFVHPHHDLLARMTLYSENSSSGQLRDVHLFDINTPSVINLIVEQFGLQIPQTGSPHYFDYEAHVRKWFQAHIQSDYTRRLLQFDIWEVLADREHLERMLPILEQDLISQGGGSPSRRVWLQIAEHYHSMGKFQNAIDSYWKVIEDAASQTDPFMVVRAYKGLSSSYRQRNEYPWALFALGQCVGWASAAIDASKTPSEKAHATYLRAEALFARIAWAIKMGYPGRTDFDENAVFGDFAYSQWKDEPEPRSMVSENSLEQGLEWASNRTKRYIRMHITHAVAYCQEALDLAEKHSLDNVKLNCYSLYGSIDNWLGNPAGVLDWHSKSIAAAKEDGNLLQLALLEEDSDDIETIKHAYHLYEIMGSLAGMAGIHYRLGLIYQKVNLIEAEQSYRKALKIFAYMGERQKQSHALHQLGRVAQAQKQVETAADLYHQSMEIKQSLQDADGMAMTFKQLGHMYIETGNYEKALGNMTWADILWFELESPRQADVEPYLRYLQTELGAERYNAIVQSIRVFHEQQDTQNR